LFGLEALGHGMVVGFGKEVIGTARRIRALFGFQIGMFIEMGDTYLFAVGGDDWEFLKKL
jgi:hypothetical protein